MNNFFRFLSFSFITLLITSCSKSDDPFVPIPLRDYKEQFITDSTAIDTYFKTHRMIVSNDGKYDVTFVSSTNPNYLNVPLMRNLAHTYLEDTVVRQNKIDYKFYYVKFAEGTQRRPTQVDSVYVNYRGTILADASTEFENSVNPVWFKLQEVIPGWGHIFPKFKTGTYASSPPNGPIYSNFGAGVVFLPSGLAYYEGGSNIIPSYTPIAFSFKLMELRYRDHDRDGILSKDERTFGTLIPANRWTVNPLDIDTDSDGVPDMYDVDDDGDNILTRVETKKIDAHVTTATNTSGSGPSLYYPFNANATETKGIPSKPVNGVPDYTSPNRLRVHLDKTYPQQ